MSKRGKTPSGGKSTTKSPARSSSTPKASKQGSTKPSSPKGKSTPSPKKKTSRSKSPPSSPTVEFSVVDPKRPDAPGSNNNLRLLTQLSVATAFAAASQIVYYELTPQLMKDSSLYFSYDSTTHTALLSFCFSMFALGKLIQGLLLDFLGAKRVLQASVLGVALHLLGLSGRLTAQNTLEQVSTLTFGLLDEAVLGVPAGGFGSSAIKSDLQLTDFYFYLGLGQVSMGGILAVSATLFSDDFQFPIKTSAISYLALCSRLGAFAVPVLTPLLLTALVAANPNGAANELGWQGAMSSLGTLGLAFAVYLFLGFEETAGNIF